MTNAKYFRSFTKKAGSSISWIVVLTGDEEAIAPYCKPRRAFIRD